MLHLSKRLAVADAQNLDDLASLAAEYSGAQWILFHELTVCDYLD